MTDTRLVSVEGLEEAITKVVYGGNRNSDAHDEATEIFAALPAAPAEPAGSEDYHTPDEDWRPAAAPAEAGLRAAHCEKCGGTDHWTRWMTDTPTYDGFRDHRPEWDCKQRNEDEHLCRGCRACGFTWDAALAAQEEEK